jgi:hypothetical protein
MRLLRNVLSVATVAAGLWAQRIDKPYERRDRIDADSRRTRKHDPVEDRNGCRSWAGGPGRLL